MTSLHLKTLSVPEKQAVAPRPQISKGITSKQFSQEVFVSWLFLMGSLMFVLDGVLENLQGVSFSSLLHLLASTLFTIGSVLFIPNNSQSPID